MDTYFDAKLTLVLEAWRDSSMGVAYLEASGDGVQFVASLVLAIANRNSMGLVAFPPAVDRVSVWRASQENSSVEILGDAIGAYMIPEFTTMVGRSSDVSLVVVATSAILEPGCEAAIEGDANNELAALIYLGGVETVTIFHILTGPNAVGKISRGRLCSSCLKESDWTIKNFQPIRALQIVT